VPDNKRMIIVALQIRYSFSRDASICVIRVMRSSSFCAINTRGPVSLSLPFVLWIGVERNWVTRDKKTDKLSTIQQQQQHNNNNNNNNNNNTIHGILWCKSGTSPPAQCSLLSDHNINLILIRWHPQWTPRRNGDHWSEGQRPVRLLYLRLLEEAAKRKDTPQALPIFVRILRAPIPSPQLKGPIFQLGSPWSIC